MTKKVEPKVERRVGLDTMTPLQSHKPSLYSKTSLVFYIRTVNQTQLAFLIDAAKSLAASLQECSHCQPKSDFSKYWLKLVDSFVDWTEQIRWSPHLKRHCYSNLPDGSVMLPSLNRARSQLDTCLKNIVDSGKIWIWNRIWFKSLLPAALLTPHHSRFIFVDFYFNWGNGIKLKQKKKKNGSTQQTRKVMKSDYGATQIVNEYIWILWTLNSC